MVLGSIDRHIAVKNAILYLQNKGKLSTNENINKIIEHQLATTKVKKYIYLAKLKKQG